VSDVRGGSKGDLMCKIAVETPINLTKKQKELLRAFQETMKEGKYSHLPKKSSWFEGVKEFFEGM
jgi:molecular chaperone DnaJ